MRKNEARMKDEEFMEVFLLLRQGGMSYEEIAEDIGCSIRTVQKRVSKLSLQKEKKLFENYKDEVIRMFNDGIPQTEICKITGLSQSCVWKNLRALGLTRENLHYEGRYPVVDYSDAFEEDPSRPVPMIFSEPTRYKVSRYRIGGKEYVDDLTPYVLYPSEKIQLEY